MDTPCLEWLGEKNSVGYGRLVRNGKRWLAHRSAWDYAYGPIPEGLLVLHRCDCRPCVEPTHLFLGTQSDNIRDCVAKGRSPYAVRTHCRAGHPFDEANTLRLRGGGTRRCRRCHAAQEAVRRDRLRRLP